MIAIRHVTGDRVVAIIEIVSPGNKRDAAEPGALVEKTVVSLSKGIHVALIDLHPPGPFDPEGLHNVIWRELRQEPTAFFEDRPLTVVGYRASRDLIGRRKVSFIYAGLSFPGSLDRAAKRPLKTEPRAVGEELPGLPLFLSGRARVSLPLASSYAKALGKVPAHLREVLEGR